jgi:uncharacterized DUF497 family protein
MNLDFEWDNAKASDNYAKHAVSFEAAERAFNDPFAIEWLDDRFDYGEDRYNLLGMVEGRLLFVAYTLRKDVIRIISARGAEPNERRRYYKDNA